MNVICSTIKTILLFYNKFCKDIESQGFVSNPYNKYVTNKIINGNQIIILWHVNYLKANPWGVIYTYSPTRKLRWTLTMDVTTDVKYCGRLCPIPSSRHLYPSQTSLNNPYLSPKLSLVNTTESRLYQ